MPVYRIQIESRRQQDGSDSELVRRLQEAGLAELRAASQVRLFFLDGQLGRADTEGIGRILTDPVVERAEIWDAQRPVEAPIGDRVSLEVHLRPGVMDPVAASTLSELKSAGFAVDAVRTARRYVLEGVSDGGRVARVAARVLANDCIEQVFIGTAGVVAAPKPPVYEFKLRTVALRDLDFRALEDLSRRGHLFLALDEMQSLQRYFREAGREPTDLELETIAQTWSEHCVHKTMKSAVTYRGEGFPSDPAQATSPTERRYANLLKETIARATAELTSAQRGPECLSVFKDNAGVIGFDAEYGIAFKCETHNRPSAIEPYGGAATGIGGCIRDVLGCGLGAKPIANTDVFCVAPGEWPIDALPKGVLHPARVLRGIVQGVADYGNRMGIPTVNGAIQFDPRYVGNPLVYCGCLGIIPRSRIEKRTANGDKIVVVGGRTGRDGIHGATFSSAELSDSHADEFSHAVQIGNAITEKQVMDAVLRARDAKGGCLFSAITDCGAGGLSSAIGEMGEEVGAVVHLERVPLKYAGLRYDEIWISEAQERMVLAVPEKNLVEFQKIMAGEGVESTVVGEFGNASVGEATLSVFFRGEKVGELLMSFLHHGLPKRERVAEWFADPSASAVRSALVAAESRTANAAALMNAVLAQLRSADTTSKDWVIRKYDHEVQGGSVIKSLMGPGRGPTDAAVLRPRFDSARGIAVANGLAPQWSDVDPYWMAIAAIDEAIRNVVCVGGDPRNAAILDNFCWGRTDDPRQMGALVRACQACYDAATAFGVPFISGKDSLNNEFALDSADIEPLIETISRLIGGATPREAALRATLPAMIALIRKTGRLSIPPTLLISAVALVDDTERCVTSDLKTENHKLYVVGGLQIGAFDLTEAARIHAVIASAIAAGEVAAAHDISDGGWLTAIAEMSVGGSRGVAIKNIPADAPPPLGEVAAGYVIEPRDERAFLARLAQSKIPHVAVATTTKDVFFRISGERVAVSNLQAAWRPDLR